MDAACSSSNDISIQSKKREKAKRAVSVPPCFLSISRRLQADLYAGTHTNAHVVIAAVVIHRYDLSTFVRYITALFLAASEF